MSYAMHYGGERVTGSLTHDEVEILAAQIDAAIENGTNWIGLHRPTDDGGIDEFRFHVGPSTAIGFLPE